MNEVVKASRPIDGEIEHVTVAARDALTDEMVGRLSATAADAMDMIDQVQRSGLAKAIPQLAQLVHDGDLDRLAHLAHARLRIDAVFLAVRRDAGAARAGVGQRAPGRIRQGAHSLEVALVAAGRTHVRVIPPEDVHDAPRHLHVPREVRLHEDQLRAELLRDER